MLRALSLVMPAEELVAIVNTGDDLELYGLSISPDLDTVLIRCWPRVRNQRGDGLGTC